MSKETKKVPTISFPPGGIPSGSYAPRLDLSKLKQYWELAKQASPAVRDAIDKLIAAAELFLRLPESTPVDHGPHPMGRGRMLKFQPETIQELDETTPWPHETEMYKQLFAEMPEGTQEEKDLKAAAHHLLWYGVELANDRVPPVRETVYTPEELKEQDEAERKRIGRLHITKS